MTREEAIQVLKKYRTIVMNCLEAGTPAFDMAIEALQQEEHLVELEAKAVAIIKSERHGEWIPCSERLPKKGEVVLITNGKGNVRCGQYRSEYDVRGGTHYWWWKGKTVESVIAWRPLPEPYKGGDTE